MRTRTWSLVRLSGLVVVDWVIWPLLEPLKTVKVGMVDGAVGGLEWCMDWFVWCGVEAVVLMRLRAGNLRGLELREVVFELGVLN